jgi:hypothetical protein
MCEVSVCVSVQLSCAAEGVRVPVWLSVDLPRLARSACAFSGSTCRQFSACALVLLGVQAGGRGQPMHAEISGDDPACMPDCGA